MMFRDITKASLEECRLFLNGYYDGQEGKHTLAKAYTRRLMNLAKDCPLETELPKDVLPKNSIHKP